MNRDISARAEREMHIVVQVNVYPRDCGKGAHSEGLSPKHLRYRGIGLIWTAIFVMLVILLIGLSLDTGKVALVAHQLHNAADAGALAGACIVKLDQGLARDQAIAVAYENMADRESVFLLDNPENDPDGDVVLGMWLPQTRTFVPTTDNPNAVKVVTRRTEQHLTGEEGGPVPLNFGALADVATANIMRYAIARSWGSTGAGLIALETTPHLRPWAGGNVKPWGLSVGGNSIVNVSGGDIQVNSISTDPTWAALRGDGTMEILCSELNVTGDVRPIVDEENPDYSEQVDYPVTLGAPYLPDPLEGIPDLNPLPPVPQTDAITGESIAAWSSGTITSETIGLYGQTTFTDAEGKLWKELTLPAGYYPGGFRLNSASWREQIGTEIIEIIDPVTGEVTSETVPIYGPTYWVKLTLESGIYALGGDSSPGGAGLYINGGTFEALGTMLYITQSLSGVDGVVQIRGGTQTKVTITEYQSETSPYNGMAIFQDRDNHEEAYINGGSEIHLEGSLYFKYANFHCGGDGLQAGTQLVAGTVEVDGGSNVLINYDGRYRVHGNRAHLVE